MAGQSQWTRQWQWDLEPSPAVLWPILADTARLGEAAGVPRYDVTINPRPDGSVERVTSLRSSGMTIAWEVRAYEWIFERCYSQEMRFRRGPLTALVSRLTLEPWGPDGSRVTYSLTATASSLIGRTLLRVGLLTRLGSKFEKQVFEAVEFATGRTGRLLERPPPQLTPVAEGRIDTALGRLEQEGLGELGRSLADLIRRGADVDVEQIRPRRLARLWRVADRIAIDLCLQAVRAGLLILRWGLLCPRCRGASLTVPALDQLPRGSHCPSCNIAFDRDFTRNVELTFRPPEVIRPLDEGAFCHSGPMLTSHVLVQQILAPGETRSLEVELPPGPYRLRTLEPGDDVEIEVDGQLPTILLHDRQVQLEAPAPRGTLLVANTGAIERTLVVETRAGSSDALTAHEATTLQGFRDLFATDTLSFGDDVAINRVAILFTDLKASTELYGRLGDGAAFRIVREHYALITAVVRRHDGAVVKTIGDSVMAVFTRAESAVAAALEIQDVVTAFNARQTEAFIVVKAGVNSGPCIAVTLNERLDYFGGTVNVAARLQSESAGGEVVLTRQVAAYPAVAALLEAYRTEPGLVDLRGVSTMVPIVRAFPNPVAPLNVEPGTAGSFVTAAASGR